MNNTFQILLLWDKGQAFAERMAAKILSIEAFTDIDPQLPTGGPDGTKDIICWKNDKKHIAGCYFPNGQKGFTEIKNKFVDDLKGVAKNDAEAFVFVTNQKITPGERISLSNLATHDIEIIHGERVCNTLDGPKGYGVRLEYLNIEMSKEEQVAFLHSHLDLKHQFDKINDSLVTLKGITRDLSGHIYARDLEFRSHLSTLPISGVNFTSRLSVEDMIALHRTIIYETQNEVFNQFGFRNVDVWVSNIVKGSSKYVFPRPEEVPESTYKLLNWWRKKYMKVLYSDDDKKIRAIATFHEKLLTIHPFLDGNGRLARVLASLQFKDLLGRYVKFDGIELEDYYEALETARMGNSTKLVDIFRALIT